MARPWLVNCAVQSAERLPTVRADGPPLRLRLRILAHADRAMSYRSRALMLLAAHSTRSRKPLGGLGACTTTVTAPAQTLFGAHTGAETQQIPGTVSC